MEIEVGERPSVVSTPERVSPKRLSYALCLLVLVLDQASKLFVLHSLDLEHTQPLIISAFFDLILVWNRGISYGLFQQNDAAVRSEMPSIGPLTGLSLISFICIGGNGLGMSLTLLMQRSLSGWSFSCMTHGETRIRRDPSFRALRVLVMIRPYLCGKHVFGGAFEPD